MKTTTVYLLCFAPGIRRDARAHAAHYLGSTSLAPEVRLEQHVCGAGSPLVKAAVDHGLTVRIAASWPGSKIDERKIKRRHNLPRICSYCVAARAEAAA